MKIYIVAQITQSNRPNTLPYFDEVLVFNIHYASSLEKCMEFLIQAYLSGKFELDEEIQITTDVLDEYFKSIEFCGRKTLGEWIKWTQNK